jgi:hypothetical protein
MFAGTIEVQLEEEVFRLLIVKIRSGRAPEFAPGIARALPDLLVIWHTPKAHSGSSSHYAPTVAGDIQAMDRLGLHHWPNGFESCLKSETNPKGSFIYLCQANMFGNAQ